MRITYEVSELCLDDEYLATGEIRNKTRSFELDEQSLTPEQRVPILYMRKRKTDLFGGSLVRPSVKRAEVTRSGIVPPVIVSRPVAFDAVPNQRQMYEAICQMAAEYEKAEAEFVEALKEFEAMNAIYQAVKYLFQGRQ